MEKWVIFMWVMADMIFCGDDDPEDEKIMVYPRFPFPQPTINYGSRTSN